MVIVSLEKLKMGEREELRRKQAEELRGSFCPMPAGRPPHSAKLTKPSPLLLFISALQQITNKSRVPTCFQNIRLSYTKWPTLQLLGSMKSVDYVAQPNHSSD